MSSKYSDWSDFQIDLELTARATLKRPINKVKDGARVYVAIDKDNEHVPTGEGLVYVDIVRFTKSWDDAGPMIDKYGLTIGPCLTGSKMAACYRPYEDDVSVFRENTLRAISELVLILTEPM